MYTYIMLRTQILLEKEDVELLERATRETGASRSELIRRAVRNTYGEPSVDERLAALRLSAGSWLDRGFTGAEYVDEVRGGLMERLRRQGLVD